MTTGNYRPGVYSRYDVSSFYTASISSQGCAVVAKAGGEAGVPCTFGSYQRALEMFSPDTDAVMLGALRTLFRCGVSSVTAVPVGDEGYAVALAALKGLDGIGAVVCDCTDAADIQEVKAAVQASSDALRECIGYIGLEDAQDAAAMARALNYERMVICCPSARATGAKGDGSAFLSAAALAGTVLAADDPIYNFNGLELSCLEQPARMDEDVVQSLLAAGVTVVEPVGEGVQIVRALTTRTMTGGVSDRTLSSLNAILIIDDVVVTLRTSLQKRLRGSRITTQSLDSVTAQVIVELAAKQDDSIIESFQTPKVYQSGEDPAACIVELSFKIAHVVSQIHVVAHIQV